MKEQRHIFGLCPNHECPGGISRLTDIEISYKKRYEPDWLDKLEQNQTRWDLKTEDLLVRQKTLKVTSKAKAERKLLPGKLKGIVPAFSATGIAPRDVRVVSNPIDFVGFDGLSVRKVRRIVLLDARIRSRFGGDVQASIEATVDRGRYDWQVLRIDEEGEVIEE